MTINELFGIRVREQRIALNLSQEKLANIADIDRTYLPDIENGKRNVSLAVAAPANSETIFIFTYLLLFKLMAKIQFKLYSNPQKH